MDKIEELAREIFNQLNPERSYRSHKVTYDDLTDESKQKSCKLAEWIISREAALRLAIDGKDRAIGQFIHDHTKSEDEMVALDKALAIQPSPSAAGKIVKTLEWFADEKHYIEHDNSYGKKEIPVLVSGQEIAEDALRLLRELMGEKNEI